ncbi:MAG TPA: PrsW family glutamic-type intramembrane protease [Acidimicrobiales bacterium]|nr:PrsW family glutamic-type intramembrane protease [Acidimicrobiales bacterium]
MRRHTAGRPPDAVSGWSTPARVVRWLTPSGWRARLTRWGLVVAVVVLVTALPRLGGNSGWGNLARVAGYHWFALAWLLAVSVTIRAVRVRQVVSSWLFGFAGAAVIVHLLAGPLTSLSTVDEDGVDVWVVPPLEEAVKLLPVLLVALLGARRLAQTGMVDTLILGYAVGAGFAFHEDALWARSTSSGFEAPWGLLFPSFFQPGGVFVVGHAGWTAIAALGVGLLVLHRRRPVLAVLGVVAIVVAVADHMAVNDRGARIGWVSDLLLDHRLPAYLLVGGVVLAVVLDRTSLRQVRQRDHLFGRASLDDPDDDRRSPSAAIARTLAASRYVRLRNGAHHTAHRRGVAWPPARPAATDAAVRSIARAGRAAGALGGRRAHVATWRTDPRDPTRHRFLSAAGWTPYVVADGQPSTDTTGSALAPEPARSIDSSAWWRGVLVTAAAIGALAAFRLLTLPEDTGNQIQFSPVPGGGWPDLQARGAGWWAWLLSLPSAPSAPPWGPMLTGAGGAAPGMGPGGPGPGNPPPPDPDDMPDFPSEPPVPPPDDGPPPDPDDDDDEDDDEECEE